MVVGTENIDIFHSLNSVKKSLYHSFISLHLLIILYADENCIELWFELEIAKLGQMFSVNLPKLPLGAFIKCNNIMYMK
jgi:hypothetical protein